MKPTAVRPLQPIAAVTVAVCPGAIIHRHGRAWTGGEHLRVDPADADRLERHGTARRVR
jgi:hypothetical protein